MRLSTRARYALRLMIDLAEHEAQDGPVILRDVADRQRISKRYLEQLTTSLRNAQLVTTCRGRRGGYSLQRPPSEITVAEIVSATMGPVNIVECVRSPAACPHSARCPSRAMWVRLNDQIDDVLEAVTLADLCDGLANEGKQARPTPCNSLYLHSEQPPETSRW